MIVIDYILNSPVLTNWGSYKFWRYENDLNALDVSNAVSAIGHSSTAEFLTQFLGIQVKLNRIEVRMDVGQKALVFILMGGRSFEEKDLPLEEIDQRTYKLGILERLD